MTNTTNKHSAPLIDKSTFKEELDLSKAGRRMFLKALAAAGMGILWDSIVGGEDKNHNVKDDTSDDKELKHDIEELKKEVEEKFPEIKEGKKWVDYAGMTLFGSGISNLVKGKAIEQKHYTTLIALLLIKYTNSNSEEKHHLVEEIKEIIKAFGIIAGTVVMGEGLDMDLEEAFKLEMEKDPEDKDKVALLTMFSSIVSPFATTVGNATIVKDMANKLTNKDKELIHLFVGHNSGRSGYILFWDPPFIAVANKYWFSEAVKWQFEKMLPLAIYSLFSTTYKFNYKLAEKNGVAKNKLRSQAIKDTKDGMKNNIGFLMKSLGISLINSAKYFTGGDFFTKQDPRWIEFQIGEIIKHKFENIIKLFYSKEFDLSKEELHEGQIFDQSDMNYDKLVDSFMTTVKNPESNFAENLSQESVNNYIDKNKTSNNKEEKGKTNTSSEDMKIIYADLEDALKKKDYKKIKDITDALWATGIHDLIAMLENFENYPNEKSDDNIDEDIKMNRKFFLNLFNTANENNIYHNITSIHRIKESQWHNLTDVGNVFPFQAGCVPFLIGPFKDALKWLEWNVESFVNGLGLGDKFSGMSKEFINDSLLFGAIMAFSTVADNYVGCKLALELNPDKPHIALIASIEWGQSSAIGNMANVAQVNLEDYSLNDSFSTVGMSKDNIAVAFAYNHVLTMLWKMNYINVPQPLNTKAA